MQLTINGKRQRIDGDDWNLIQLLQAQQVQYPATVFVQLNGAMVAGKNFEATQLKDQDEVEILYYVGGG